MDKWVDELIDRWAYDVHFHNPLSKLRFGLERHSTAVQTVFNILYQQTFLICFMKKSPMGIIRPAHEILTLSHICKCII